MIAKNLELYPAPYIFHEKSWLFVKYIDIYLLSFPDALKILAFCSA